MRALARRGLVQADGRLDELHERLLVEVDLLPVLFGMAWTLPRSPAGVGPLLLHNR
jgi:hypothetical protein